jgi:hypothetical protein
MDAAMLVRQFGPFAVPITVLESEEIGTIRLGEASVPILRQFNSLVLRGMRATIAKTSAEMSPHGRFISQYRCMAAA